MNISKTLIATGVLAAFVGVASPAIAQHRGGGHSRGSEGSRGSAVSRDESRAAAPRESSAPRERSAPRESSAPPRQVAPRADSAPQVYSAAPRQYSGASRGYASAPRGYATAPRAYSNERGGGIYRGYASRGYASSPRGFGDRRAFGLRVGPARFYRPYYTFRPRLSLGFGLWVGYPFAYYDPYYYPDYGYSYGYSYPYPDAGYPAYPPPVNYPQSAYPPATYPQPAAGAIGVQQGPADISNASNTGGVSFDITPGNAELFVDGNAVGPVDQFTPTSQPLGLIAGRHRVEIRAPGYQPIAFDVNIVSGQVIPYQGAMELARQ